MKIRLKKIQIMTLKKLHEKKMPTMWLPRWQEAPATQDKEPTQLS